MAIDADTRSKLVLALERTRADGRDLFEVLDAWGLILTPHRRLTVQTEVLERLWHKLDETSTSDILQVFCGKKEGTPADMHRATLDFLEAMIKGNITERMEQK